MLLTNRGAGNLERLVEKTLGLLKPHLCLHHPREVVAGFDFGEDIVCEGVVVLLKRGFGRVDTVAADIIAGAVQEGFEVGDAFLGFGEGFVGIGDLGFEFGDASAQLSSFGFICLGKFVFEVGFEFTAQADEFGRC